MDESNKVFCIINFVKLVGEMKRKLMNELVDLLNKKKSIRVLFFLGKSNEENVLYSNFMAYFNHIECYLSSYSSNSFRTQEKMKNCTGNYFYVINWKYLPLNILVKGRLIGF